jgi:hypothetical protein
MKKHIDARWIEGKIDGHGGGYTYSSAKGLAIIRFIGNKNCIQVFGYNVVLLLKYLVRKLKSL